MPESHLEKDNTVQDRALNDLGWVGVSASDPEVVELRRYLAANNGIKGLELLAPDDVERAATLFHRDGFVVIRDVLDPEQLACLCAGCDREIHSILAMDKDRRGNRGSHRYSFGSSSKTRQLLHLPEWAMLVDLPRLTPIVTAIFGAASYRLRGAGGDFCLPGATDYQRLHSDMSDRIEHNGRYYGSFLDHRKKLTYRDLPTPYIACNFLITDFTAINGPTRQVPGTQHAHSKIPRLDEEPEWMKLSTVCPAPAGSVLIRDTRAWHGGTPNVSDEVRAIPNVEFFAPWYQEPAIISMPYRVWEGLSDHGRQVARGVVADSSVELETGYLEDLGRTPYLMRKENQDKDG